MKKLCWKDGPNALGNYQTSYDFRGWGFFLQDYYFSQPDMFHMMIGDEMVVSLYGALVYWYVVDE